MKKKKAYAGAYREFFAQFEMNLKTVNYSIGTIYSAVNNVRVYLDYLENNKIELKKADTQAVKDYFKFLETRTNKNTGLGLSLSYLQKIRSSFILFYDFLHLTQSEEYPNPRFPDIKKTIHKPKVLTKKEVEILFKTCDKTMLGKRNKAMLALYYGCGLRRQEGTELNIEDIDLNKGSVFIAKSKTHKQRIVFMSENTQKIIEDYMFNVREKILPSEKTESAFLVSERGQRISTGTVTYILNKLVSETKNQVIIQKKPSIHTLRHSIATHLLQAGMKFENIALFLGHSSLDSTQIYTHLSNEN